MRVQYTVAAAVAVGLGESVSIVRDLIYSGHIAARFERGKWIIPASEIIRCEQGLPLTDLRRQEIMSEWLDEDGHTIRPRNEAAA